MTRDEIIKKVGRKILRPIGIIQIVFIAALISTPFIWIWHSWSIAWRVGLSGWIGVIISWIIYEYMKNIIENVVDKTFYS